MQEERLEQIEQLVENPTWKEMLLELVATEQLDPWNIDIVRLTDGYLKKVLKMKTFDLRVPANVILAASILLRFKSDTLRLESEEQVVEREVYIDEQPINEVSMLQLRMRVPPRRTVSLADLINALEEVMTIEKRLAERPVVPKIMELKLPKYDIEKEIARVYTLAKKKADSEGWLAFSDLTPANDARSILLTLLPLLHLSQGGKVHLLQEEIFGDILIKVGD